DVGPNIAADTPIDLFACPICYEPLIRKGPPGLKVSSISRSGFQCQNCKKAYSSRDVYLDLTVTAGMTEYIETKPIRTELFRSPVVSFVYERGWRQNFARRGFPGPDEEFKMAQRYLLPAEGGLLVDVSCGSGLFSRRFVKCGHYSGVVALDFSENMLRQCYEFVKQDRSLSAMYATYMLVLRCIAGHLPLLLYDLHPLFMLNTEKTKDKLTEIKEQHQWYYLIHSIRHNLLYGLSDSLQKRKLAKWVFSSHGSVKINFDGPSRGILQWYQSSDLQRPRVSMEEGNKGFLYYQRRRKADQPREEDNVADQDSQEAKVDKLIAAKRDLRIQWIF
ncbi:hypothetical protein KI387_042478, partial [Taxus chinensis]